MKKISFLAFAVLTCCSLSGCGLMEDAFKAGFIIALVLAVIVGLLIWILHFSYRLLSRRFPEVKMFFEDFWSEDTVN